MKVLINNRHIPHLHTMAEAMPDICWFSTGWNGLFRPKPDCVTVAPLAELIQSKYDAVVDDDISLPAFGAEAPRKIYLEHCEHDAGNSERHAKLKHALEVSSGIISVSEHKRATMRDVGINPKVSIIRLYVPESEYTLRTDFTKGLIGTAHNNMTDEMAELFEKITKGFNRVVIGIGNIRHGFPVIQPENFEAYKTALSKLNVWVNATVGEQLGYCPMEAMMSGVPMVTGSIPEAWNFCFTPFNCFIHRNSPKDSVEWLRDKIKWLMENPSDAERIGKNGRPSIIQYCPRMEFRKRWMAALFDT